MKKLLLLLMIFFTLSTVTFASFPVVENTTTEFIADNVQSQKLVQNQTPFMEDDLKILLLAIVVFPLILLEAWIVWNNSPGSFAFILAGVIGAIALFSDISSLVLNFKTKMRYWNWKNYLALLISLWLLITPIIYFLFFPTHGIGGPGTGPSLIGF